MAHSLLEPHQSQVVKLQEGLPKLNTTRFRTLETKATENSSCSNPSAKKSSILCAECDGNGIKLCGQCEGSGVNSKDHFNGRFKAGGICWLCRGKREILCGNCNGGWLYWWIHEYVRGMTFFQPNRCSGIKSLWLMAR